MPAYLPVPKNQKKTPPKIAEQPFAPIPSLPGEFGKKEKKKKTGGFGVK